jgi:uncharacterized protein involved in outer membrane biogenesis
VPTLAFPFIPAIAVRLGGTTFAALRACPPHRRARVTPQSSALKGQPAWRRPWFWPLAVLIAFGVILAICESQGWPFLRRPAERQLSQRLQRPVEFGDAFALHLLRSVRVSTDSLRIGPRTGPLALPDEPDLLRASDAYLEVPHGTAWRLMRGDTETAPHIRALRVGKVDAALRRDAQGNANWSFGAPRKNADAPRMDIPEFDELVIRNGHVSLDDRMLDADLDARVSTTEGAEADRPSGLRIDGKGSHRKSGFDFRVASTGVLPLVAPADAASAVPLSLEVEAGRSRASFVGSATDVISLRALDGTISLAGPSLAAVGDAVGVTLPTTAAFVLKGRLAKAGNAWSLKQADLRVGSSHVGGDFSFDRGRKVPLLKGELNGERLVLADLAPAFGAATPGAPNPPPPPGKVLPEREFDVPSLHAMDAAVSVRLKRAELGRIFARPLEPMQGDLTLEGGVLKISNLLARAAGGELKGGIGIDARNTALPAWSADVRWGGIELEEWLRPRNTTAKEVKSSGQKPGFVTGRLGGHANLQGRGRSTAKVLASTGGTLQAWVRDGTISHLLVEAAGIDVAQGLGLLVVGDDPLPMTCAALRAKVDKGVVLPEVAIIDTRDSTLFLAGAASLASEKLDLVLTVKPKDMSPATLRSAVLINGTFSHPQVHLDAKKLTFKAVAAAALASLNPLAALLPLFDPGDKAAAGGCERTLQKLRDADGPAGARDAKAPKATDRDIAKTAAAPASGPLRR